MRVGSRKNPIKKGQHVSVLGSCIACGARCPNGVCPNRPRVSARTHFDTGLDEFDLKVPKWFWPLWILGILGSLTIGGLIIWGLIKIVPALVAWLDRH